MNTEKVTLLKENLNKIIIGKDKQIEQIIAAFIAEGHVLIEDLPGTGKTLLAKTLARSINGSFSRIQFTPDLLPNDIVGIHFYNQQLAKFEWRPGPIHANIVLADELNRTTPRSQSALLEAMAERQVSVDNETILLPKAFFIIATQNPIETDGTFTLPEAQLDRFMIKISLGYPNQNEEKLMINRFKSENPIEAINEVISIDDILNIQQEVKNIHIEDDIINYIINIVSSIREHQEIEVGPSSRATLALVRYAQALAYINERQFVLPEDIQASILPILEHRLILSMEASLEKTAKDILAEINENIQIPIEDVR